MQILYDTHQHRDMFYIYTVQEQYERPKQCYSPGRKRKVLKKSSSAHNLKKKKNQCKAVY